MNNNPIIEGIKAHVPPERLIDHGDGQLVVKIYKRPNPMLQEAYDRLEQGENSKPHRVRFPKVSEDERGLRFTDDEVGWVFKQTEEFVAMTTPERHRLVELIRNSKDYEDGRQKEEWDDLIDRVLFPSLVSLKP